MAKIESQSISVENRENYKYNALIGYRQTFIKTFIRVFCFGKSIKKEF